MKERILVIRIGALGDIVMCTQAFADIRAAHPDAEIALLTTPAFEKFTRSMPWFDDIIAADRAPMWRIDKWLNLVARLYRFAPRRVYDLQGKFRQSVLFMLLGGPLWGPEWSGAAPGCSHPRLWPPKPAMHFSDFIAAQLRLANVPAAAPKDMSWLDASLDGFNLPAKFALLIPGSSPKLLGKRWPVENYAELARRLKEERGLECIAIGSAAEADTVNALCALRPDILNLCGKTSLHQIAALARRATCVIGNDTGPLHIAAVVGAPALAIMSRHTKPLWSRPYGPKTNWVKRDNVAEIDVNEVMVTLDKLLPVS